MGLRRIRLATAASPLAGGYDGDWAPEVQGLDTGSITPAVAVAAAEAVATAWGILAGC